jgi:hypothetical protein
MIPLLNIIPVILIKIIALNIVRPTLWKNARMDISVGCKFGI